MVQLCVAIIKVYIFICVWAPSGCYSGWWLWLQVFIAGRCLTWTWTWATLGIGLSRSFWECVCCGWACAYGGHVCCSHRWRWPRLWTNSKMLSTFRNLFVQYTYKRTQTETNDEHMLTLCVCASVCRALVCACVIKLNTELPSALRPKAFISHVYCTRGDLHFVWWVLFFLVSCFLFFLLLIVFFSCSTLSCK